MGFFAFIIHNLGIRLLTHLFLFVFWFPLFSTASAKFGVQSHAFVDSSDHFLPFSKTCHFKNWFQRIVLSVALGVVTGLSGAFLSAWFIRSLVGYLNRTPLLEGPLTFSPKIHADALQSALRNETQLLDSSSSPHGKYYRAVLANGLTVAVKKLEPIQCVRVEARRRMQQQPAVLGSLRHRNLMSLRAYVGEMGSCYLVYDFVPTGSLEDAMRKVRENQSELKCEVRLRMAVGIARGLQFLHFECDPRILHSNLKPANVLLDAEFEPRLADCGLTNLMPSFDRPASSYTPPECLNSSRDRTESRGGTEKAGVGGSLGRWIQESVEPGEALDKSMIGEGVEKEEMGLALRIGGVCVSELPEDRPCSDELLVMLTRLQSF